MGKIFFILSLFIWHTVVAALKCDKVVKLESTEILSYLGNVTFLAPGKAEGDWTLNLKTSIPFRFIGGWDVRVQSDAEKGTATFKSVDQVSVKKGDEISFRFRIHYGQVGVLPLVKSIQWEQWVICEGVSDGFKGLAKRPFRKRYNNDMIGRKDASGIVADKLETNEVIKRN